VGPTTRRRLVVVILGALWLVDWLRPAVLLVLAPVLLVFALLVLAAVAAACDRILLRLALLLAASVSQVDSF
jgi:hypothetical protein